MSVYISVNAVIFRENSAVVENFYSYQYTFTYLKKKNTIALLLHCLND